MNTLNKKNREELSLLLPWYANGTLNEEDSRKVEEAMEGSVVGDTVAVSLVPDEAFGPHEVALDAGGVDPSLPQQGAHVVRLGVVGVDANGAQRGGARTLEVEQVEQAEREATP